MAARAGGSVHVSIVVPEDAEAGDAAISVDGMVCQDPVIVSGSGAESTLPTNPRCV